MLFDELWLPWGFPQLEKIVYGGRVGGRERGKEVDEKNKKNPRFFHVRANEKIMKFFKKKLI